MKKLIIISGPTASGKTALSIELCQKLSLKAEIVNFDSLLFYKELSIGTAKPSLEERGTIPHHLIDISSAKDPLNAADYIRQATELIEGLMKKNIIPIVVGGSGFYLRALIKGMYETTETPEPIKTQIKNIYETQGIAPIIEELKKVDPLSHSQLHPNDHYRLIRAYEFYLTTGIPISKEKEKISSPYDFSTGLHPDWNFIHLYLDLPKPLHEKIIRRRAEKMLDDGLIAEVQQLLKEGFDGSEKPLQSIGYKEVLAFLKQEIPDKEKLVEQIVIATRQLAKSQRTFFAKVTPKHQINPLEQRDQALKLVQNFLAHSL